jgi:hypothetical protein
MSSATPASDDDGRTSIPPSTTITNNLARELYTIRELISALLASSADSAFKTLHCKTNAPELLSTIWLNQLELAIFCNKSSSQLVIYSSVISHGL